MTATHKQIAAELAGSLAQHPWTAPDIAHHLTRRLPAKLATAAEPLAAWLCQCFPHAYAPTPRAIATAIEAHPALIAIHDHCKRHKITIAPRLDPPRHQPTPAFTDRDLPPLACPGDLADHLGLTMQQLTRFADLRGLSNATDNPFAPHYRFHLIPKRSGGTRLIEEPKPLLKRLQRRLLRTILDRVPVHAAAHGFVRGRSCAQAAQAHAGEAMVLCFDLKDYFPSITLHRIHGLFRCMGYPHAVARHLTGLTTLTTPPHVLDHIPFRSRTPLNERHLPQGAPTSPALANLTTHRLDRRLAGLARRLDATYTRYADDLTFSGDPHITKPLLAAVPRIALEEGFRLNTAKTRIQPATTRQTVTGIVVNQHLNTPRQTYDRLKATLHRLDRQPDPEALHRLDGQIRWLEGLNPHKGAKLRARWQALDATALHR